MERELFYVDRELAGSYSHTVLHDSLVKMRVRAFGWEVNRNNFQIKREPLELAHVNAFGEELQAYKSFENTPCNRKHLMQDNGNSSTDQVIGFVEHADLEDDGVYLSLVLWKRCMSDEELRQIREYEVEVSMEVDYDEPVNIIDGQEIPVPRGSRRLPGVVRSFASTSTVCFQGLGILFDGKRPGYASSKVLEAENAALVEPAVVSSEKTNEVEPSSLEVAELSANSGDLMNENELAALKEELAKANERALAAESTITEKQAELEAKGAELDKLYAELEAMRKAAWDEAIAANFDLGKIGATTLEWLLTYLRWNTWTVEEIPAFALKFKEIGAAVVAVVVAEAAEEVPPEGVETPPVAEKPATETETETAAEVTPEPAVEPEVETETAAEEVVNIAGASKVEPPSPAPARDRKSELRLL